MEQKQHVGAPAPPEGEPGGTTASSPHDRSQDTVHERTVVPEAKWGVTSGAPSGGVAGGTPASQVRELTEDE